jgi:proprotein convertase subtilisin/kexin type 5
MKKALLTLAILAALAASHDAAFAVGVPCSQVITNCQFCFGGSVVTCQECQGGWGISATGECQACAPITANCTTCKRGECSGCTAGYQLQNGACVNCTAIDPNCQACSGTSCTSCPSGYGLTANNTQCQLCSSIDPNCTSCNNGLCTSCASGYGLAPDGASCQPCSNIDPNCLTCATSASGKCQTCGNGFAANLAGQCVADGTSTCTFSVGGQCCKCQYSCQSWNPATGSCVGSSSNDCGPCLDRQ